MTCGEPVAMSMWLPQRYGDRIKKMQELQDYTTQNIKDENKKFNREYVLMLRMFTIGVHRPYKPSKVQRDDKYKQLFVYTSMWEVFVDES